MKGAVTNGSEKDGTWQGTGFYDSTKDESGGYICKRGNVLQTGETVLKINDVEPNKDQPRKNFNEEALKELSDSIKLHGIVQPLVVSKQDDYYEIIAGERRWRAAKMAGLKEVPVVIKDYSPQEIMEVALIENIQREDLNPVEEAKAYQRLIREYNLKQEEVAEKVSRSRTAITNSLRLLKLGDQILDMLVEETITSGHARALWELRIQTGNTKQRSRSSVIISVCVIPKSL